ncbi:MAG: hypothetical protein ACKOSS_00675 [Planctomycetia bacterium]
MLRRLLKILLAAVLVLALLGVAAFTWLCHWPLEGRQGSVEALVPASAQFLVRGSWDEVAATGWLQRNLREAPLVPPLGRLVEERVLPLLDRVQAEEARINAQLPLGFLHVSLHDDLLPGEVVAAGRWCRDARLPSPPSWREAMVLLRVSWKVRAALAALEHGFVREQVKAQSGVSITPTDEPGVLKVLLPGVRVSDVRARSTCGDGFVMTPEDTVYLARVRDVLVAGNSLPLVAQAAALGRSGATGEAFAERPGFSLEAPEGSLRAAIDLQDLKPYLERLLEAGGSNARLFKWFLGIQALDRMNGHLALASPDLLAGRASIRLAPRGLGEGVQENYRRPGLDLRDGGLSGYLPAADTFAVVHLRTDAMHLLNAVHDGILSPEQRRLWSDNMRESAMYTSMDAFLRDVAERLGDAFTLALGRLSRLYDEARYPAFEANDDKQRPYDAEPALAVLVTLRKGASPEEVDRFLAERVHLLGFSKQLERATYKGFTYTRLKFARGQELAELQLYRPAYILVQDKLLLASHEDYFLRVLDTFAEPKAHPALSADPTYRVTMEALPPRGHLAVFVDVEKLTRVPASAPRAGDPDPAGGPRGFLWDLRNWWAWQERDPRSRAIELRTELVKRYGGASLSDQQYEAVQAEVRKGKQAWMERYPEFLEEWRQQLLGWRRIRSAGLVLAADGERLAAEVVGVFRDEGAPRAP